VASNGAGIGWKPRRGIFSMDNLNTMVAKFQSKTNFADPEVLERIKRERALKIAKAQKEAEEATKKYLEEQEEFKKLKEQREANKGSLLPLRLNSHRD
jgi:hypothetical protein